VGTASGGNHGLAVATAARILGLRAAVYVPETVPAAKARRLESSGAELLRVGTHYAAWASDTEAPDRERAAAVDEHAQGDPQHDRDRDRDRDQQHVLDRELEDRVPPSLEVVQHGHGQRPRRRSIAST
jgi:cysteine synthase